MKKGIFSTIEKCTTFVNGVINSQSVIIIIFEKNQCQKQ